MRLMPASSAAARKPVNERFTPGDPSEVELKRTPSLPKNVASTAAAAPLKLLCPDVYAGNGGVGSSGDQSGSAVISGLLRRFAERIAVTGRQTSNLYLQSQQQMAASASATFSIANSRAFSASVVPSSAATDWAMRFQWPGGVTVP